ncbi:MAG: helix-turn-helix domain-containing protein [Paludibacterium sp.]|uniref:helix-turn-helix domain-containing protein n=1 Tax=Paludibacterium sp. TaxID=1917523 RepID=UPI0025EB3FED|nr:helix-turn-helix domain-containing protein [Paludibacterium sp.]MBV8048082.1 helix-turn-helix domain-containing protein [Paludibacterium sp.]
MSSEITPEKAALKRAIEIVGGQSALAEKLGFQDRRRIWIWLNGDRQVPVEQCPEIELATRGKVRCEELRPDVKWHVLRERPKSAADTAPEAETAKAA